jgi:hypothetical protein
MFRDLVPDGAKTGTIDEPVGGTSYESHYRGEVGVCFRFPNPPAYRAGSASAMCSGVPIRLGTGISRPSACAR